MALLSDQLSDLRDLVNFESSVTVSKAAITQLAAGLDTDDENLLAEAIDRWTVIKGKFTRTTNALNWGAVSDPRDEKVELRDRARRTLGLAALLNDGQGAIEICYSNPEITASTICKKC
jgi:hypothetical protein